MLNDILQPKRFAGLDGLRVIAVTAVFFAHAPFKVPDGLRQLKGYLGMYGVTIFFVISGFIITHNLLRELKERGSIRIKDFFLRRARCILPGWLIVISGSLFTLWWLAQNLLVEHNNWGTQSVFDSLFVGCLLGIYLERVPRISSRWSLALLVVAMNCFYLPVSEIQGTLVPMKVIENNFAYLGSLLIIIVLLKSPESAFTKITSNPSFARLESSPMSLSFSHHHAGRRIQKRRLPIRTDFCEFSLGLHSDLAHCLLCLLFSAEATVLNICLRFRIVSGAPLFLISNIFNETVLTSARDLGLGIADHCIPGNLHAANDPINVPVFVTKKCKHNLVPLPSKTLLHNFLACSLA